MKRLMSVAAAAVVCASQAAALSCIQPDAARAFQNAAEAEESYVVLLGQFDFIAPPKQPVSNDAQPQQVLATFEGQGLGADGFVATQPKSVQLETACAGAWCGGFPTPGADVVAFVELTQDGYLLSLGACGGSVFEAETAPIVEACMRGEACAPSY